MEPDGAGSFRNGIKRSQHQYLKFKCLTVCRGGDAGRKHHMIAVLKIGFQFQSGKMSMPSRRFNRRRGKECI